MYTNLRRAVLLCLLLLVPGLASAHQPELVLQNPVVVDGPEISKAYYGQLQGQPQVFTITSGAPFALYLNVLVPDVPGQKQDVSAVVIKNGDAVHPVAVLDATTIAWKKYFEPFGYDNYYKGPEYRAKVEPGQYEIRVWSSNNDSKYSLAVGEIEAFGFVSGLRTIFMMPKLKRNFFVESPATFMLSPIGAGYVAGVFVFAALVGVGLWLGMKKFSRFGASKNVTPFGRVVRFVAACILFVATITSTWNIALLFAVGYLLFEALFGWCLVYTLLANRPTYKNIYVE